MAPYYIPETKLLELLRRPAGMPVFMPTETDALSWLDCLDPKKGSASLAALGKPRSAQSPKGFFLPACESVGRYGSSQQPATAVETAQTVVVGIRACELRALNYLDKVMLEGEFEDPAYRARREGMLLISCDCVDCTETCFCPLVGGQPYTTEGFDINLTPMPDGYLADVATQRGSQWLGEPAESGLSEASPAHMARRDQLRKEMVERLEKQNAQFTFTADDKNSPELPNDSDEAWQQFAADCVECAACTNICPTCHCFYLYDQLLGPEAFERVRTWDSCLLSTYHRMAGGVNMKLTPRANLFSRLANRVLHKFTYSPQQYELLGCVGCGRCIDACLGAIDIRNVVQDLSK